MTELSFLLELLLNHKLPKVTREAVTARVKEVEQGLTHPYSQQARAVPTLPQAVPPHLAGQAPSTIAALMRHEGEGKPPIVPIPVEAPPPVIAVTPAAQAALAERNALINQAVSGKPEKGRTSPRKF